MMRHLSSATPTPRARGGHGAETVPDWLGVTALQVRLRRLRGRAWHAAIATRHRLHRRILLARLPKQGEGAEIGVWRGDFSARLLRHAKPSRLHLIDPWQHPSEQGYEHARFARRDDSQMELIYRGVRERFGREIACGQVVIHRHPSAVAVAALPPLDWVYIDGDHTYEGVAADLRSCWARLTPNGRVAGDDYGVRGWWEDGVTKAVDEFARSEDCKKTIIGTQFLLRKVSPRDEAGRRRKPRGRA